MERFNFARILAPATCIALGIACAIVGQRIFYYHGRDGLMTVLPMFWGGLLLMIGGAIWFVFRVLQQASWRTLLACAVLLAAEAGVLVGYYIFVWQARWFVI